MNHTPEHCFGTANAGSYEQGLRDAFSGAGPAFHAGVAVDNLSLSVLDDEDPVRTYVGAHSATGAFLAIQGQCGDVRKIT